jgi:hypothetical protein
MCTIDVFNVHLITHIKIHVQNFILNGTSFRNFEYGKTKGSKLTIQLHCDENQSPFLIEHGGT